MLHAQDRAGHTGRCVPGDLLGGIKEVYSPTLGEAPTDQRKNFVQVQLDETMGILGLFTGVASGTQVQLCHSEIP